MGGMGMGGMRFPEGFGDEDDDMDGFSSMPGGSPFKRSRPDIFGGHPGRSRYPPRQSSAPFPESTTTSSKTPKEIIRPLPISLEDLWQGTTKRLKVGRKLLSGHTEERVLEIDVQPGWKSGTKVKFPKAGNETADGESQDLVFIVEEKPHPTFTREGNDLITKQTIPLADALCGPASPSASKRTIQTVHGTTLTLDLPSGIIKPGTETKIPGEGMPIRKSGVANSKGNLIVRWQVDFPKYLSPAQKDTIRRTLQS
jgi:DnaJ family protein B protein 4